MTSDFPQPPPSRGLSTSATFLLIFLGCTGLILCALYFQYIQEMAPCPLCITQRIFVILVGMAALAGWLHNLYRKQKAQRQSLSQQPPSTVKARYAIPGIVAAIIGGGVSARHVWLQGLPDDLVPSCGPGLNYLFDTLPIAEALSVLFAGDGNCAEISWRFLGLSMPAWTLVCFAGLAVINLYQLLRRN